jgi:transcription-repair coupling factor (superfamily II helicase)
VALLHVGYLRAECHRLGINDIQISGSASTGGTAKLAPLQLKLSETMRLRRISKGAKYKEDLGQLVVPLPRGADASTFLAGFLRDLIPADT